VSTRLSGILPETLVPALNVAGFRTPVMPGERHPKLCHPHKFSRQQQDV